MDEEQGIYRGEVMAVIGALADLRSDVRYVVSLLEDADHEEEEQEDA